MQASWDFQIQPVSALSVFLRYGVGLILLSGCNVFTRTDTIRLVPGLVITESVTIETDHYEIAGDSLGAIQIHGDGITVDFNGAVLDGRVAGQMPDEFAGVGVRIGGSSHVTIRNAVIRGYKVAIMATDAPDVRVTASNLSYNWRQRLKSTIERESQDDWMSYHQNEKDEWLRFGAAIYLRRSDRARIDHVTVTGGQNGIMATEVNDALFYNNVITFNSSVGIGLYRSSRNRILHNQLDFNVRGHSPGVYNRGQDSAALLLYEQSNDNVIAFNSATHSGDGLFLWAGQSTMDTGEGGCNDNLIYSNDFSFAPTNGIEVTFSRNQILGNRIEGCWHGIWGGYSFDTLIDGNNFIDNEEHIAVEHGQNITITHNQFSGGDIGLRVWERAAQPADWVYSTVRDVRSRGYQVSGNSFEGVREPFRVENTAEFHVTANSFSSTLEDIRADSNIRFTDNTSGDAVVTQPRAFSKSVPERMADGQDVGLSRDQPKGRDYMLIDEWGPYDFRSPLLWPRSKRTRPDQTFELLGPPGKWRIVRMKGIESVSRLSGERFPGTVSDTISVRLVPGKAVNMLIELEFVGQDVTDRFGRQIPAQTPFIFSYSYFYLPVNWHVRFFSYDQRTDPIKAYPSFRRLLDSPPAFEERRNDLTYQWYGAPAPGLPENHFATVAEGSFQAPDGRYELDVTSDDGIRVWLDGKLIHDDWTYHAPRQVSIAITLGGNHTIRVEHFEIDGYATLIATFRRIDVPHTSP